MRPAVPKKGSTLARRPRNLAELDALLERVFSQASRDQAKLFKPRPTDIIISPYSKSGTTWLQQIAHGLRTRGSMDFEEITEVTPWIEAAKDIGWDLDAPQVAEPRVFKSHLDWHEIPKGGRYICSFRNPVDAHISFYRFFEGWFFEPGSISIDEMVYWRYPPEKASHRSYWQSLISWWEQRHNPDVLLLCYEDMQADLPAAVRRIAAFMQIELDTELEEIVLRQSSKEFMLAHQDQFDEKHYRRRTEALGGLPADSISLKVMPGHNHRSRYRLSPQTALYLDRIWQEQIESRLGFKNYGDFREDITGLK